MFDLDAYLARIGLRGRPAMAEVHRAQLTSRAPTCVVRARRAWLLDSKLFPISLTVIGAGFATLPGALRQLHLHPNADEWQYWIEGTGRMTVFGAESKARTFDFQAGDVGYVPFAMGHYIQNTGETTLRYLEMFDFGLVRTDMREREVLLRLAPHLVQPLQFLMPMYRRGMLYRAKLQAGMQLYDALSFDKSLPTRQWLNTRQALRVEPGLSRPGLQGAWRFYDGQVTLVERLGDHPGRQDPDRAAASGRRFHVDAR